MADVSLVVIPKPPVGTRSVLINDAFPPRPTMKGTGAVNLLCGGCDFVIVEGIQNAAQVQSIVFQCPRCSAYNETRL